MRQKIGVIGTSLTALAVGLTPNLHKSYAGISTIFGFWITTYRMGA